MKAKPLVLSSFFFFFLIGGFLSAYVVFQPDPPASVAEHIAADIRRESTIANAEIEQIIAAIDSPAAVSTSVFCPFFIYEHDSLVYWSDNHFVPAPLSVADTFDLKLLKTGSGAFLAKKKKVDKNRYIVLLIMLQRDYIINNDYLNPEWNKGIFPSGNFTIYESGSASGVPVCLEKNCLFRISFTEENFSVNHQLKTISCTLFIISLLFLLALMYDRLKLIGRTFPETGFFYLFFSLWAIRWLMTSLNFPNLFIRTQLFDPQIFASSSLSASLGDLLLNIFAVLLICRYIFRNFYRFHFLNFRSNAVMNWLILIVCGLCVFFTSLFPFVVIQTLYNNSSIILDISQSLQFDGLRITAMAIVLLSGICSFLFSHAFIRILASDRNKMRVLSALAIAAVLFSLINEMSGQSYASSLVMAIIYFMTVYFLKLYSSLKRLSYTTFAYLFVCIFCLSVNGAYCIQFFSDKEKIENQFRFANNFLIDRDIFGEDLLSLASRKIAGDVFIQTRLNSPFLGKDAIGQKIRQVFLPNYFNKYDVEIFVFNAAGQPADNHQGSFSEIVNRYDADAFRTAHERIYYVNNPESDVTQKYLMVVPIERLGVTSGYVVVELSLKKIIPENVYPELLVDYRFQQFYRTHDLSYSVFAGKNIVFTSGEFNYEKFFNRSWLGKVELYTQGFSSVGYDHIGQEDQNGRVAVVSTRTTSFTYRLANFSFLFVLGLLIILFMILVQGVYNYFRGSRLFFTAKVQLYLNLAFFIPLIIVCISTLSLTTRSSQQQLDAEYLNKSKVFGEEITSYFNEYINQPDANTISFPDRLADLAKLSNLDANVYSNEGRLFATSQPLIFESHLISSYINSAAFNKVKNGENAFIESEQVGKLNYFVAYAALISPQTGKFMGILGIPFFQSAFLLEKAQIVLLANILNIFAFIFITLLALSYFVSEWLTFPLRFITRSLKRTSLTKTNHPLTWKANDEIGLMVREYNGMLYKLSESKNELEQIQREKAWREIAQQVAHEIKNPLTPMKLTLQQLERSLQSGNDIAEKSKKAIAALLAQVDTLNGIASSFSGFAKMPELSIRKLDIVAVVKRTVDLHSPSGTIQFRSALKDIFVMGDEQMLSRTFSNILLNGLQSGNPGQAIRIEVSVEKMGNIARIEFQDNGKGIAPTIADRVFLPHFSTKRSGTGLGLAISKQGIEQMGGKIWFETTPGKGTSFFIELPAAE